MNQFWVCILSVFIFWAGAGGCGSEKDTSKKVQTVNHLSDTTDVNSDTTPEPPPPGLPPGQAKVKGKIITITKHTEDSSSGYITFKVDKVLGYGSSTPPIAADDSIRITTSNLKQKDIQIGKIVSVVLSYRLVPGQSKSSANWSLTAITTEK